MNNEKIIRYIDNKKKALRVAAYCRVSTHQDEQMQSYQEQVSVYTDMINSNPAWIYAGIYADPGITGTSVEKRPQFLRMVSDAKAKKLDLILCKSISRFARNAIEAQKYVDILKENGVVVYFEEEKIRTDDPGTYFIFELMASVAQDESRSISENVKWSIRSNFSHGEYHIGNNRILGYNTIGGRLVPNQDAWIIVEIYKRFLSGQSYKKISDALMEMGASTLRGKKRFHPATIVGILRNETYKGDKQLQKHAPVDYLTKRPDQTVNYETFYIEQDHEPIIDSDIWNEAQVELERRKKNRIEHVSPGKHHPLYGKVICGYCGAKYVRRTLKGTGGTYQKAWNCLERQKGVKGNGCTNRIVWESDLMPFLDYKTIIITKEGFEFVPNRL